MEQNVCKTEFESQEQKIREVFSTPFILRCVAGNNLVMYNDIFLNPQIKKMLKNEDIITTAKIFLDNDLNLSKASKKWFLHRNTMIYRINKIKQTTGLDIRKFEDAVLFANMLELAKNF